MSKKFGWGMVGILMALAVFAQAPANATLYTFNFSGSDGVGTATAVGTFDAVAGQMISGTGTLTATDFSLASDTIDLVTLSTPGVHDLGGGGLSYRFGGGTDLIGNTNFPVDSTGIVFQDVTSLLDVGFNIWSNGGDSYTGFLAGDSGIYRGYNGTFTTALADVPEASTIAMMLAVLGLGFFFLYRPSGKVLAP